MNAGKTGRMARRAGIAAKRGTMPRRVRIAAMAAIQRAERGETART